ncbi:MAG: NAD+ synthase [Halobacteriales archaeon]|nr:NAD+ synthase [Halobacteriales archaeon]
MSQSDAVSVDLSLAEPELDATREHIVAFIRDQVQAAGTDRAVMGLSGGIDSTLTSHLAVEALGTENVHGLVMPGAVSRDTNMSDAERVAESLEIEYDIIAIDPIVETIVDAYPDASDDHVAVGNARARTRAVLNYLVANHEDALVIGTGNRTEALVGYFTKYGDGAVDCHPIGNLYKQQVRQLAVHIGVPEDIVHKTPSAELWADQTDEEELGIDYDTLDAILALTVDGPVPVQAAANMLEGVTVETIERIIDLHEQSAHKRAVPPAPEPRR